MVKVRVGGGYLSLEEFLDQYTPIEMEKITRTDPINLIDNPKGIVSR